MRVLENFTFQDSTTTNFSWRVLKNTEGESLTICVSGLSGTNIIVVDGKQGDVWFGLGVVNLYTLENVTEITEDGDYAVVGVAGFEEIRCTLNNGTAGSVTVTGRLCAE